MPIYKGSSEIDNIMLGSTQIETVYKGTQEVWNNNAWYLKKLTDGTSFDIRTLGLDPSKFTADNFITLGQPSSLYGYCEKVYSSAATSIVYWYGCYVNNPPLPNAKNYSNGVITFYYQVFSRNTNNASAFGIWLLSHEKVAGATKVKDKNVIPLGFGSSFDIKTRYANWQSLNANNFYMVYANMASVEDPDADPNVGSGPVEGTGYINKSYNSSTGILTFYNHTGQNNAGVSAMLIVP